MTPTIKRLKIGPKFLILSPKNGIFDLPMINIVVFGIFSQNFRWGRICVPLIHSLRIGGQWSPRSDQVGHEGHRQPQEGRRVRGSKLCFQGKWRSWEVENKLRAVKAEISQPNPGPLFAFRPMFRDASNKGAGFWPFLGRKASRENIIIPKHFWCSRKCNALNIIHNYLDSCLFWCRLWGNSARTSDSNQWANQSSLMPQTPGKPSFSPWSRMFEHLPYIGGGFKRQKKITRINELENWLCLRYFVPGI